MPPEVDQAIVTECQRDIEAKMDIHLTMVFQSPEEAQKEIDTVLNAAPDRACSHLLYATDVKPQMIEPLLGIVMQRALFAGVRIPTDDVLIEAAANAINSIVKTRGFGFMKQAQAENRHLLKSEVAQTMHIIYDPTIDVPKRLSLMMMTKGPASEAYVKEIIDQARNWRVSNQVRE